MMMYVFSNVRSLLIKNKSAIKYIDSVQQWKTKMTYLKNKVFVLQTDVKIYFLRLTSSELIMVLSTLARIFTFKATS